MRVGYKQKMILSTAVVNVSLTTAAVKIGRSHRQSSFNQNFFPSLNTSVRSKMEHTEVFNDGGVWL